MANVTIKELLEAGVHFGHQTRRWNPKMARYIFGERNGIYIINLEKTLLCLEEACAFLERVAATGKEVLFVGTKKQAQSILQESAQQSAMPYVVNRWLGGMLTNYETVSKSITRMKEITTMDESGSLDILTKKERLTLLKDRDKMKRNLEGIKDMKNLPGAVFIVDTKKEDIALKEAKKLGIPVVAVVDTNGNPDDVDFPIPGNDDALRAIAVICRAVTMSVQQGRQEWEKCVRVEEKKRAEEAKAAASVKVEVAEKVEEATAAE